MNQKSFILDLNRCTGCGACIIACSTENIDKQGLNWRQVCVFNETRHPDLPLFSLSMSCNHCLSPACLKNCPASAYKKDPGTGAVIIEPSRCIGCKYCTWACPYDAPRYNEELGIIEKCDFCIKRQEKGELPACVDICPTHALQLVDTIDMADNMDKTTVTTKDGKWSDRQRIPGFTGTNLQPAIRFKQLRNPRVPELTTPPLHEETIKLFVSSQDIPGRKITLKAEWILLLFTTLASLLVSWFALIVAVAAPMAINPYIFLGTGAMGLGLSTIHLGKKLRAYRAIFNIRNSWLSREILFFSLFYGMAGVYLLFFPDHRLGIAAAAVGFISLFCIDKIYQVAMKVGPLNFHSAHTLLNALYLTGILIGNGLVFGLMGGLKLFLYLSRKLHFRRTGRKTRILVSILRIITGFIAPLILLIVRPGIMINYYGYIIISVIIGEVIDRTEYYDEMDIITPRKQMLLDLEAALHKNNL
ncbi:MAG: dimethyl sulfoxide reductase anchor subunit [Acidobacteria bacterium]|jgi:Fe-S-cluster-containing dehydrogenase component/DMSO reductase anchor subunit|nr:dimethyl sulfoxide reductase anchor subunit [Acidobacteriota bacterium]